jgi:hypothetical protein
MSQRLFFLFAAIQAIFAILGVVLPFFGVTAATLTRAKWVPSVQPVSFWLVLLLAVGSLVFALLGWLWHQPQAVETPKWIDKLEVVSRHRFVNEQVELDGKMFDHCYFENVTLIYHGTGGWSIIEGTFGPGNLFAMTDNKAARGFAELIGFIRQLPATTTFSIGARDAQTGQIRQIFKEERVLPPPAAAPPTPPTKK